MPVASIPNIQSNAFTAIPLRVYVVVYRNETSVSLERRIGNDTIKTHGSLYDSVSRHFFVHVATVNWSKLRSVETHVITDMLEPNGRQLILIS